MRIDRIPAWPKHHLGQLLQYHQTDETPHHTLGLQYYEVPVHDDEGRVIRWNRGDYDVVKPKPGAPGGLSSNEDWDRIFEEPEVVAGMKYRRVVRVRYRHKRTGEVVGLFLIFKRMVGILTSEASREVVLWQPDIFPGGKSYMVMTIHSTDQTGVITQPQIQYADGSKALLYLEEWRPGQNKVVICE
jgi:hypothetical protein